MDCRQVSRCNFTSHLMFLGNRNIVKRYNDVVEDKLLKYQNVIQFRAKNVMKIMKGRVKTDSKQKVKQDPSKANECVVTTTDDDTKDKQPRMPKYDSELIVCGTANSATQNVHRFNKQITARQ